MQFLLILGLSGGVAPGESRPFVPADGIIWMRWGGAMSGANALADGVGMVRAGTLDWCFII